MQRGTHNGLTGLRWLSEAEMAETEPNVAGVAGVHVPEEGIADYRGVWDKLRQLITAAGGEIVTSTPACRSRSARMGGPSRATACLSVRP